MTAKSLMQPLENLQWIGIQPADIDIIIQPDNKSTLDFLCEKNYVIKMIIQDRGYKFFKEWIKLDH